MVLCMVEKGRKYLQAAGCHVTHAVQDETLVSTVPRQLSLIAFSCSVKDLNIEVGESNIREQPRA